MTSENTMHCLGCGYDLRGSPGTRCPECGREFEPTDPATYLTELEDGRSHLFLAGCAFLAVAFVLTHAALSFWKVPWRPSVPSWIRIVLMATGFAFAFNLFINSIGAWRRPVHNQRAMAAAFVISLATVALGIGALVYFTVMRRWIW